MDHRINDAQNIELAQAILPAGIFPQPYILSLPSILPVLENILTQMIQRIKTVPYITSGNAMLCKNSAYSGYL